MASKFKVRIVRTEFYAEDVEIEAETAEEAVERVEDQVEHGDFDTCWDMPYDVSHNVYVPEKGAGE